MGAGEKNELLAALRESGHSTAASGRDGALSAGELAASAAAITSALQGHGAVLLWSTTGLATVVGLVGALAAGTPLVPLNPSSGPREIEHILADVRPTAILVGEGEQLPPRLADLERI